MKLNALFVFILFKVCGFGLSDKCRYNIPFYANWTERLATSCPDVTLESKLVIVNSEYSIKKDSIVKYTPEKFYNFYKFRTRKDSSSPYKVITVSEYFFDSPCDARDCMIDELTYFQSQEPRYDKNTSPCAGMLQDTKYYAINAEAGNDEALEIFLRAFIKSLLKKRPAKKSIYFRHTSKVAYFW